MTQEQIKKVLAERDGLVLATKQFPYAATGYQYQLDGVGATTGGGLHGWGWQSCEASARLHLPDYPNSTDALRPVLAKLSEEEWKILEHDLEIQFIDSPLWGELGWLRFLLTLPPEKLSECVAEAIVKAKGAQ